MSPTAHFFGWRIGPADLVDWCGVTTWAEILPDGWHESQFEPFGKDPWFRAEFPSVRSHVDVLEAVLDDLAWSDDPTLAKCRVALDEAMGLIGRGMSDMSVSGLVSDAHHAALMAYRHRPSWTTTAIALVISALRAWMFEQNVHPMRAVVRDLGWERVPSDHVDIAVLAANVFGFRDRSDSGALFVLPVDDPRVRPVFERVADHQFVSREYRSRSRRWVHPAEAVALRLSQREGDIAHASGMLRAALRRYATGRYEAAHDRIARCRALLPPAETSEAAESLRRAAETLEALCADPPDPDGVLDFLDGDDDEDDGSSVEDRLSNVAYWIEQLSQTLFEKVDPSEDFKVEALIAGYDVGQDGAAVVAWGHSLLAELHEADDSRWIHHKRIQLDTEDACGVAIASCSAISVSRLSDSPRDVVIVTPPPLERARDCITEAELAIEDKQMARARFWLERAEHYRNLPTDRD